MVLGISGCQRTEYFCDCEKMGYVPVEKANEVIILTNELIDAANVCYGSEIHHIPFFRRGIPGDEVFNISVIKGGEVS